MASNDEKIDELIEDVVLCRKLVPKSVEAMEKLSKKYYQQWKFEIDKKYSREDIQVSDDLKANADELVATGSTEELRTRMINTFRVLERMLENQKSTIQIDKT